MPGQQSSNAEAMAMRRCCAKFRIARYLWFKEQQQQPSYSQQPANFQSPKRGHY